MDLLAFWKDDVKLNPKLFLVFILFSPPGRAQPMQEHRPARQLFFLPV
jgi:hypothetical protein